MPARFLGSAFLGGAALLAGCGAASHRAAVDAHVDRAEQALLERHPDRALAELDRGVALAPRLADLYLMRAQVLKELRRDDEAARDQRRALRLEPDHPGVVLANAQQLVESGEADAALLLIEAARARRSGDENLLWYQGLLLLRDGRAAAAAAAFGELRAHAAAAGTAFQARAAVGSGVALAAAEPELSARALLEAADLDGELALEAAAHLADFGLRPQLEAALRQAVDRYPAELGLGLFHAGVLAATGQADAAVAEAERLLELGPSPVQALRLELLAAAADAERMRYATARERLGRLLDREPAAVEALMLLYDLYVRGRGTAAEREELERRVAAARPLIQDRRAQLVLGELARRLTAEAR